VKFFIDRRPTRTSPPAFHFGVDLEAQVPVYEEFRRLSMARVQSHGKGKSLNQGCEFAVFSDNF